MSDEEDKPWPDTERHARVWAIGSAIHATEIYRAYNTSGEVATQIETQAARFLVFAMTGKFPE